MTPEERSDLASLHALSLLHGEEAALAARLEASDPAFAAEVAAFSESIAILAETVTPLQPSDLLRERVLALPGNSTRPSPAPAPAPVTTSTSRPSWLGWAAAAVLAISCASLWVSRDYARRDLAELRSRNHLAGMKIATLESQLDQYQGTRAVVVWDPVNLEGQIQLAHLPPTEAGKDLQLWIVDPAHEHPVSGGLIHRAADGTASVPFQPARLIKEATAFAISVEQAGGVEVGKGPIVLLGK